MQRANYHRQFRKFVLLISRGLFYKRNISDRGWGYVIIFHDFLFLCPNLYNCLISVNQLNGSSPMNHSNWRRVPLRLCTPIPFLLIQHTRGPISIPTNTAPRVWRHQMETVFALLALCARNSPLTGEFPAQRPVTRSFDVLFDLRVEWTVEYTIVRLVIWDANKLIMTSL